MSLTVRPTNSTGHVDIYEDKKLVGTGRMKPSITEPGYCTLTLRIAHRKMQVIRVPICWITEMGGAHK